MAESKQQKLLVTGAGGQLGRLVVGHLLQGGASGVVAGTRDPGKLADLWDWGVELREATSTIRRASNVPLPASTAF
ncbi:hypothetical protein [Novosphingobium sp. ST904]|uniref:hypothetical protein n=1 Tax=Novosphingobium sp. ST904 TaxID=1684385 RepID=UPI000A85C4A5|nr:hypothetical protein [Novosphingobium sp. ST904]